MNDLKKKAEAAGYPPPSSRAKNDALYRKLLAGDPGARSELIKGNMALVIVKVDSYLRQFPNLRYFREDLISAGLLSLVQAVDGLRAAGEVPDANPTGYIYTSVQNGLSNAAQEECLIAVPRKSAKRAKAKGQPIAIPKRVAGNDFSELATKLVDDPMPLIELRDEIDGCCRSDVERKIVQMRHEGYLFQEIAEALDIPLSSANLMLRRVYARFLKRTGMKP